jgi:putative ABC transport system permease protein
MKGASKRMARDAKRGVGLRQTLVSLREATWLAFDTLRTHKLRTFLTLLGVILAVTTLVAVMSVLNGLNLYVSTKIANLGSNAFIIDKYGIITSYEAYLKAQKRPTLTIADYYAMKENLRYARNVAGYEATVADVHNGRQIDEDVNLLGATPEFTRVESFDIAVGREFTEEDELHRVPICFLGSDVAQRLFPSIDPVGREVRVGEEQYQVVGVAKPLGTVLGQSRDNFVMIPLSTYLEAWAQQEDSVTIFVQAISTNAIPAAVDEARVFLRARHHQRYADPDDFGVIESSSLTDLWKNLTTNIFGIAIWLTSVFLVVGGIVIMNIMLASVTERTREIGVRKSLGARRSDIVMQFLMESSTLAAAGGAMGVIFAEGVTLLVRATTPIPMSVPIYSILVALLLSSAVGLFFGIYPAVRASRLDPIEALRAET